MWQYRPVETVSDRPVDGFDGGHFWIREFVTGGVFAVEMADSGLLTMAGPDEAFDPPGPWPYRRAMASIRDHLDRDRLRNAVDDVSAYTFYVLAPLSMGVTYDWESMPPAFGLEIWDGTADSFVPVDVTDRVYREIGLWPIPTVEREVHARDLSVDPSSIPAATYGTETAAGLELRKKRGRTVAVLQEQFESVQRVPPEPAGRPASFKMWLEEQVDAETVNGLLEEVSEPLEPSELEAQVKAVATELARRRFDEIGHIAMAEPDRFESRLTDRLVTLGHATES